jgi:hypothetical protein
MPKAPGSAAVPLPGTFPAAVRAEFGRAFRPPYATLLTIAANGAFMNLAWFFLPRGLKDDVFTLHGSLAFALVLAAWMYSDVPATNVLAPDRQRVMAALDDPVLLRRLLYAKNVVLWTLITPVCVLIAVFSGILGHHLLTILYTVVWIGVVPFGAGHVPPQSVRLPRDPAVLKARRPRLPRRDDGAFRDLGSSKNVSDLGGAKEIRTPDLLHAMQARTIAERGPTWHRMPFSCGNTGWTWPGVAWCLASLAPYLAPSVCSRG